MTTKVIGAKGEVKDSQDLVTKANHFFVQNSLSAQILDANSVVDLAHLELARRQASRRFTEGKPITRSLEVEFLLYVAATHQIDVAIDRVGVKIGSNNLLIVVLEGDEDIQLSPLLNQLDLTEMEPVYSSDLTALLQRFGISTEQPDPRKAVYEAMSLVNLEK
jgi:tRNA threonylcarbamoyladenosine modification (KEOPS) complex Cgi121 subunit